MQKGFLIFLGLLALSSAATLFAEEDATTDAPATVDTTASVEGSTSVAPEDGTTIGSTTPNVEGSTSTAPEDGTTIGSTTPNVEGSTSTAPEDGTTIGSTTPNVEGSTSTAPEDGTTIGSTATPATCLYENRPWADEDVRKYNLCLNGVPYLTQCNEGRYYVNNATISGCVQAAKMNPNCVNLDVDVGPCTGINLEQPQESDTLTNFYLCLDEDEDPVELTCLNDMAFVKQDGYLGCFNWTTWRSLRDCPY